MKFVHMKLPKRGFLSKDMSFVLNYLRIVHVGSEHFGYLDLPIRLLIILTDCNQHSRYRTCCTIDCMYEVIGERFIGRIVQIQIFVFDV